MPLALMEKAEILARRDLRDPQVPLVMPDLLVPLVHLVFLAHLVRRVPWA